jgi:diphthine-ammonia ligase
MCGILGVYGQVDSRLARASFGALAHRGHDGSGEVIEANKALFHCLHAVVGDVKQPLRKDGSVFLSNCEIYNWETLNEKYGFGVSNDAEVLFALLELKGVEGLRELDGVYAFAWEKEGMVYLLRDILGVKPLCYVYNENIFAFASEGKVLMQYGNVEFLLPTDILVYDIHKKTIQKNKRKFFSIKVKQSETEHSDVQLHDSKIATMKSLQQKLIASVEKRVAGLDHFGILFSGGVDSAFLAFICKKLGKNFTCYTAAFADGNTRVAPDFIVAKEVAAELGFTLKHVELGLVETEKLVKDVVDIIETKDPIKVGVAMPFYLGAQLAAQDECKVLFSGLGSEELFAGYKRHLDVMHDGGDVNKECLRGLSLMWDRDLYRDDLICMKHTVELRLPFLDKELVEFSLGIPSSLKIGDDGNKKILRELAVSMGMPSSIAMQPKRAAQYGSNFDKALEKLAKKSGTTKRDYLSKL